MSDAKNIDNIDNTDNMSSISTTESAAELTTDSSQININFEIY